jgi:hypothetical protein
MHSEGFLEQAVIIMNRLSGGVKYISVGAVVSSQSIKMTNRRTIVSYYAYVNTVPAYCDQQKNMLQNVCSKWKA